MKEKAKIFTCENPTNHQKSINDAALELCKSDGSFLMNKGKLFKEARKKVNDSGYKYVKKKSRSNVYGTGRTASKKPKRKYTGAEIRAERMKEINEAISSVTETVELLSKQKQQYSNVEKFLQAADVNSSILEKNREKAKLEKELKELKKAESKSKKTVKKRRHNIPTTSAVASSNDSESTDIISSDGNENEVAHLSEAEKSIVDIPNPLLRENAIVGIDAFNSAASAMRGEIVEDFQLTTPK